MHNSILKEALEWWDNLTIEKRNLFPESQSDLDILEYYENQEAYMEIDYSLKLI